MKRIFHLILVFLLITATSGVAVSSHYCGEILKNISINKEHHCCQEEEMPEDCCFDDVQNIKVEDNLQLQNHKVKLEPAPVIVLYYISGLFTNFDLEKNKPAPFKPNRLLTHAEPDIFLRVQSFLL